MCIAKRNSDSIFLNWSYLSRLLFLKMTMTPFKAHKFTMYNECCMQFVSLLYEASYDVVVELRRQIHGSLQQLYDGR